eukprot:PhM_4_TR18795/c0_g1_i2/m.77488
MVSSIWCCISSSLRLKSSSSVCISRERSSISLFNSSATAPPSPPSPPPVPPAFSCCCSRMISSFMLLMSALLFSSLTLALHTMAFALMAYLRVLMVSSVLTGCGEMAVIMMVFELPPRESDSTHVRTDSRNGGILFFWLFAFSLELSMSTSMTLRNVDSDKLMFLASVRVSPVAPDDFTFSEPARSTRLIVEILTIPDRPSFCVTWIWKMAWERLLWAFIFVSAMARSFTPRSMKSFVCAAVVTGLRIKPSTMTPFCGCRRIFTLSYSPSFCFLLKRSRTFSLYTSMNMHSTSNFFVGFAFVEVSISWNRSSTSRREIPGSS